MKNMMKMLLVFVAMVSVSWGESISLGETVHGSWTEDSLKGGESNRAKERYVFTLSEHKRVRIELDSALYEKVRLFNSNDEAIAKGYDYWRDGKGSYFVKELDAGTYTIDVTTHSWAGADIGSFTLKLTEAQAPAIHTIGLNSSIDGALTEASGLSGSGLPKEYYTFTLAEAKKVLITLDTNIHNERLRLYDTDSNLIKQGYDTYGDGVGSKIVVQLEAGTYTIDVTNNYYTEYGNFKLRLEEAKPIATHTIELNSTVESAWTEESGLSLEKARAKEYYTFTLTEKTNLKIILESNLNERLRLYNDQGERIKSGEGAPKSLRVELDAGTYTIDVSTLYGAQLGNFGLTLEEVNIRPEIPLSNLNDTINGEWTLDSQISHIRNKDTFSEYYTFTITEEQTLLVELESSVDTYLIVLDENGNILKRDDDGGEGYNSKIEIKLKVGTYTIEATTYRRMTTGSFKLNFKTTPKVKDYSFLILIYGLLLQ